MIHRMRAAIVCAIAAVGVGLLPASVLAQGNSSIEQYTESIPTASGDEGGGGDHGSAGVVPGTGGGAGGGGSAAAGAAVASPATSPPVTSGSGEDVGLSSGQPTGAGADQGNQPGVADGDVTGAAQSHGSQGDVAVGAAVLTRDSATGDSIDPLLPILLGASLLVAIAVAVGRRLFDRSRVDVHPSA